MGAENDPRRPEKILNRLTEDGSARLEDSPGPDQVSFAEARPAERGEIKLRRASVEDDVGQNVPDDRRVLKYRWLSATRAGVVRTRALTRAHQNRGLRGLVAAAQVQRANVTIGIDHLAGLIGGEPGLGHFEGDLAPSRERG